MRRLSRNEAIEFEWVRDAEKTNNQRFVERTFTGDTNSRSAKRLLSLTPSDPPIRFEDEWDAQFGKPEFLWEFLVGDTDFALAYGRTPLKSTGKFRARFQGDLIVVDGAITHEWKDRFDFHRWQPGAEGALTLEQYRGAGPFSTLAKWEQPIRVYLKKENRRLTLGRQPIWGIVKELY